MNITYILLSIFTFLIIVFLLNKLRKLLISSDKQVSLKHSIIPLSCIEKWIVIFIPFIFILIFMFLQNSSLSSNGWITIGIAFMSSIFIIPVLQAVLDDMRGDNLSMKNFVSQDFLLLAYLIVFTELTVLNWLKDEVTTYFTGIFVLFMVLYSIIIIIIGFYLTFSKKFDWKLNSISILDSIILICLIGILTQITLTIILLI